MARFAKYLNIGPKVTVAEFTKHLTIIL